MTKEELIKKIGAEISKLSDNASQMCEEYEGYHLACQDISDVLHEITKEIQSSLPSDLDEAAEKATKEYVYNEGGPFPGTTGVSFITGFKAGAEWMAGQGVSTVAVSGIKDGITEEGMESLENYLESLPSETEVVLQIRKKQ